jgi:cell division protein FtsQ
LQSWIVLATRDIFTSRGRSARRRSRASRAVRHRSCESQGALFWRILNARADQASRLGVYLSAAFLLTVAVYGAALGGHLAAWQQTLTARAEAALIAGGFGIHDVILKGGVHTPGAQVHEALRTARARTIFGYDTRAAKLRLEDIGWVESARVMRLWPSTLVVELREREAFARWDIRGHTIVVDREGEILGPVTPSFADLPRIAGEGAHTAAADMLATLAEHPAMARKVTLAERIEQRRWDLILSNGLRVQLPARDASAALPVLAQLLGGDLPGDVAIIDMRVPGRIALRKDTRETDAPGPTAQLSGRRAQPL